MTKAILLDADGVVLEDRGYFSDVFSLEHNVPLEQVLPFFKGRLGLCQKGQADLRLELVPYLEKWGWKKPVDDFLHYWFSLVAGNKEVLNLVDQLRSKGVKIYLATNNEKYRSEYIKSDPQIMGHLDGGFFSYEIGHKKSEKEFFDAVLNSLGFMPEEIMFFDNDEGNVQSAVSLGIQGHLFKNFANFQEKVSAL